MFRSCTIIDFGAMVVPTLVLVVAFAAAAAVVAAVLYVVPLTIYKTIFVSVV